MKPITIHTDFDAWAAVLTAYLRAHQKTVIEGSDAYIQPFPSIAAQTSAHWTVTARVRAMLAEDADFPPNGDAMTFDVIRLGAARLQITPHCYTEAWRPYLEALLADLRRAGLLEDDAAQPAQAARDEEAPKKPRVPGPGADLDELNALLDWKTMKEKFGPHHNYDAQRLLTILNCLPAAKDGCAAEQENWMSQGQKHIMNQAPGVDETELSRYLSNARKCGLLEWRGVLLPGRPFTK